MDAEVEERREVNVCCGLLAEQRRAKTGIKLLILLFFCQQSNQDFAPSQKHRRVSIWARETHTFASVMLNEEFADTIVQALVYLIVTTLGSSLEVRIYALE